MAVGMLICPDPNGNCAQSSGNDCQMDCDGVACSCPADAQFTFIAEGPSFEPSSSEIQQMESMCGGPSSYVRIGAVDAEGNTVSPQTNCDQTDESGKVTRKICYKCDSYSLYAPWSSAWAYVGPNGEGVFIG